MAVCSARFLPAVVQVDILVARVAQARAYDRYSHLLNVLLRYAAAQRVPRRPAHDGLGGNDVVSHGRGGRQEDCEECRAERHRSERNDAMSGVSHYKGICYSSRYLNSRNASAELVVLQL